MSILTIGLALAVGACAGGGGVWAARRPDHPLPALPPSVAPDADTQLRTMLGLMRQVAIIVGPYDQVIAGTDQARRLGIYREGRIVSAEVAALVGKARREGAPYTREFDVSRGIAEPSLHLVFRVAPLGAGEVAVVAEDKTMLLRMDETRRDFVANVSHELKTPIGAIALLAEAVEEAADDPPAVRHFAGRMQSESKRLIDLVSQIIELSRLQADDPLTNPTWLSVDSIIAQAIDRCRELAARRHVDLSVGGDPTATVLGDAAQLTDAVANLVQNAIAYSDEHTQVAVTVGRDMVDEDDVELPVIEIRVSDQGIGISPEDQQRIFERFYRVSYSRSRESGGTGLGLSIVKHIAAAHGGAIQVSSELGKGSTFTLQLPSPLPDDDLTAQPLLDHEKGLPV